MVLTYRQEYNSVSRQLCSDPIKQNGTVEQEFFLGVSTSDPKNLTFVTSVTPVQDFLIKYVEPLCVSLFSY